MGKGVQKEGRVSECKGFEAKAIFPAPPQIWNIPDPLLAAGGRQLSSQGRWRPTVSQIKNCCSRGRSGGGGGRSGQAGKTRLGLGLE